MVYAIQSSTNDSAVNIIHRPPLLPTIHRESIIFPNFHCPRVSRLALTFAVILLLPGAVLAAERIPDDGKAIQPNLGIRFDFDSNIYSTSVDEIESWISIITPAILFSTAPAQQRYSLLYEGEYGRVFADSADDYADHVLTGVAQFQLSSRGQVDFAAATEKGHWGRGSYQTDGLDPTSPSFPAGPDKFDRHKWGGKIRYGAEGNRGRLRFGFGGSQLDYTNNRERTQFLDYETLSGSAGLSLLFHQRTAVVFDAVFTDIRYENERPGEVSRESEDWRLLLGLTWEATAKTSGSIRFGLQRRRFDDPSLGKTSNPSWDVNVRWSPREYSHFDFATSRRNEETFAEGAFIDVSAYKVAWTHEWNRGWESIIKLTRNDSQFVGSPRDQDFTESSLGLRYRQGRLLTWEAGYARRSRDSSLSELVYDGDMFSIGVNIGN